jgi:hypothetical protein
MDSELYGLDLSVLQTMYHEEAKRLNDGLLAGASWESLREQKQIVVDLAIVIHKKKNPQHFNPAEFEQYNDRSSGEPFSSTER